MYFYLWEHHLVLLHGMVAEYIGRAVKAGMPDDNVYEKQLVRARNPENLAFVKRWSAYAHVFFEDQR